MISEKTQKYMYGIFRILVGAGFLMHGGQKLFGWFGGPGGNGPVAVMTTFGFAGIVEVIVGTLVILGLFVSLAAIFGALNMIGAWALVHIKGGFNPLTNGGELAMLYFASFLVLIAYGAGVWSLERALFKKEFMHIGH